MRLLSFYDAEDQDAEGGEPAKQIRGGTSKHFCLKKFKDHILAIKDADLYVTICPEYKCYRRLTYHAPEEHPVGGNKWEIQICENGAGEIEPFDDKTKAIERFLEIVEEDGEHWESDFELEDLKVKGVRKDKIEQMRPPEDHEATQKAAENVIRALDESDYSREQVHAILKWALYISTQA